VNCRNSASRQKEKKNTYSFSRTLSDSFYNVIQNNDQQAGAGWGGEGTPCSGLYGKTLPERGAFFKFAVY